jgi:hypothetical protein
LDFEPPFQEQFYYAWITQVIIDSENLLLFQLDFSEGRPSLVLDSFERERLCEELAICWKADFMFRKWTWQTFSLKRGLCDIVKRERTASEFTTPPDKMQKMEMMGYFMFADEAFRADPPGPDGQPTGCYRLTGRDTELKFIVECPQSVAQLGRREKDLLRLAAERVARSMSADSEMMVLRSEQYHKRMNLMGDLASWACWTVHLRTPQLDIGVIATRRKYIPPVGDQYQDLFIVQTDDVETRESAELFMQGLERPVESKLPGCGAAGRAGLVELRPLAQGGSLESPPGSPSTPAPKYVTVQPSPGLSGRRTLSARLCASPSTTTRSRASRRTRCCTTRTRSRGSRRRTFSLLTRTRRAPFTRASPTFSYRRRKPTTTCPRWRRTRC